MQAVTREQVITILEALGVEMGDGLLVHSSVQFLGRPAGGPGLFFEALCSVLGIYPPPTGDSRQAAAHRNLSAGTLAVPTFNFAFARGEPYDPLETPSNGMGVFSEYVRRQPGAMRTTHPMQSLAVAGRYAADLAARDTPSAFDPGSAFERMLELDFKLLLLGAGIQAVSMLHYSEQRAGVPYRYWKDFQGQVRSPHGWELRTYRMFVRDLDLDAHLDLQPVQALLDKRGRWASLPLNYGSVSLCRLSDFVAAVDEFLSADPWSLVTNREEALKIFLKRET